MDRLSPGTPFNNVIIDFSGPFRIKQKSKKVRCTIYLCNITKSLHLELDNNYSANGAITALTIIFTFSNLPLIITSDARKNSIKGNKMLLDPDNKGFKKQI